MNCLFVNDLVYLFANGVQFFNYPECKIYVEQPPLHLYVHGNDR